jgi:hypothetical protein
MFYFKKNSQKPGKSLKINEIIYLLFLNILFGGAGQKYLTCGKICQERADFFIKNKR